MPLTGIVSSLVAGFSVGGVAGWAGKLVAEWLSLEKKRRDALDNWMVDHIAAFAPTYGLLGNYAYLIGATLTEYFEL
jgi:hypothetical protein